MANSYGFRPQRSAHQALLRACRYYNEGYKVVVDLDMKQYFDTVNHDKLMAILARDIHESMVLRLIRRFLTSGIMVNQLLIANEQGTPQGGNLSPLLANIYLNEFDQLLKARGHKFVRYADDCNIYVKSKRAGTRVLASCTKYLEGKLKLTVNQVKSIVGSPTKQKFLGFCISPTKQGARLRPHRQAKLRIKAKLKQITKRNRGRSLDLIMHEVRQVMTGWLNYYGIGRMKEFIHGLNQWLKHRLRQYAWKQWKKIGTKIVNLIKLGISRHDAWIWANTRKGYWAISGHGVVNYSMKNEVLARWGYQDIAQQYEHIHSNY